MKIGVFSFGGCEGCRYYLLKSLLKIANEYEIVREVLLGLEETEKPDIAIIEGAISSKEDLDKVKEIRERTKILIALGSCAVTGGIPSLINERWTIGIKEKIYGPKSPIQPVPLDNVVKVDYRIRGCPPYEKELERLIKTLSQGLWFSQNERRLEYSREKAVSLADRAVVLDGEKCIACGRCVNICNYLGVNALGYANRGIEVSVTTPFNISMEEAGCIGCGLCTLYCPVSALYERSYISEIRKNIPKGYTRVMIEPEVIKALESVFNGVNHLEGRVVAFLKKIGFTKVVIGKPVSKERNILIPGSEAEYIFIKRFYPDLLRFTAKPPKAEGYVLVSPCIARKISSDHVISTRELLKLLSCVDLSSFSPEECDRRLPSRSIGVKVTGPRDIRNLLESIREEIPNKHYELYICPGGCIRGGGQPYQLAESLKEND